MAWSKFQILEILGSRFGFKLNSKGYKVLPSYIRVIQGDGMNYDSMGKVLQTMKDSQWSADNVVFGSGGALVQDMDRDTQKCAFKCSFAIVDGKGVSIPVSVVTLTLIIHLYNIITMLCR